MRTLASHVAAALVGVTLATAAGAMAQPAKQPGVGARLARLEARYALLQRREQRLEDRLNVVQANYQSFCNALKGEELGDIQDSAVSGTLARLRDACWVVVPRAR